MSTGRDRDGEHRGFSGFSRWPTKWQTSAPPVRLRTRHLLEQKESELELPSGANPDDWVVALGCHVNVERGRAASNIDFATQTTAQPELVGFLLVETESGKTGDGTAGDCGFVLEPVSRLGARQQANVVVECVNAIDTGTDNHAVVAG